MKAEVFRHAVFYFVLFSEEWKITETNNYMYYSLVFRSEIMATHENNRKLK